MSTVPAVRFRQLSYSYEKPVFTDLTLDIPAGSRTLLVGANGTGKSTLLRLIAGRHILPREMLEVHGHAPFYGLAPGRDVTLVDQEFPIDVDLRVSELLAHASDSVDRGREAELIELFEVSPDWRMHRISEGQRRRVQLLLALRKVTRLLLLDEITSNLDILMRTDFLNWLKTENERTGLPIVYATHILDGLDRPGRIWPTHVLKIGFSTPPRLQSIGEIAPPLLTHCEDFIRQDVEKKRYSPV